MKDSFYVNVACVYALAYSNRSSYARDGRAHFETVHIGHMFGSIEDRYSGIHLKNTHTHTADTRPAEMEHSARN